MTKTILKEKALRLRADGFSYSFIRNQLNVSKSTLSRWLEGVPFNPNNDFVRRVNETHSNLKDLRRKVKRDSENKARLLAAGDIGQMTQRDLLMLGLGIYMGEGSKTVGLRVVNSDPTIIRTSIRWLKRIYGLGNENFKVRLHLYPEHNQKECLEYWTRETGLPLSQFYRPHVDQKRNKSIRNSGKLLFGTAHVTIRSANNGEFGILLMRRILNSIEFVNNQAGLV